MTSATLAVTTSLTSEGGMEPICILDSRLNETGRDVGLFIKEKGRQTPSFTIQAKPSRRAFSITASMMKSVDDFT